MDAQQLSNQFDKIRTIFLGRDDLPGVQESNDSNAKKLLIQCPYTHVSKLSALIHEVERNVPEIQIDLELNSLEDAFIKIAERDIRKEQDEIKEQAQKELYMSEEDEQKAMEEYFAFEGHQSACSKICMVAHHRIKLFYRDASQWIALLIPILFVTMMAYILYSFVKVIASG